MEIKYIKTIHPDKIYQNFDYAKYAVYNDIGKFCGFVFEHDGEFLTSNTSEYFPTAEEAAITVVR